MSEQPATSQEVPSSVASTTALELNSAVDSLQEWLRSSGLIKPNYTGWIHHLLRESGDPELSTVVQHGKESNLSHIVTMIPKPVSFTPFDSNILLGTFSLKPTPGSQPRSTNEYKRGNSSTSDFGHTAKRAKLSPSSSRPPLPTTRPPVPASQPPPLPPTLPPPPPPAQPPPPNAPPPPPTIAPPPPTAGLSEEEKQMKMQAVLLKCVKQMISIKWPRALKKIAESWKAAGIAGGNPFAAKLTNPSQFLPPHYFETIEHPIDLSTIRERVEDFFYMSFQTFAADCRLVYTNALTFNKDKKDPVHKMAIVLKGVVEDQISKGEAQLRSLRIS